MPQAQPSQPPPTREEFDALAKAQRDAQVEFERLQATVAQLKPIVDQLRPAVQALQERTGHMQATIDQHYRARPHGNHNRSTYVNVIVGMTLAIVAALVTIIVFVQTRS